MLINSHRPAVGLGVVSALAAVVALCTGTSASPTVNAMQIAPTQRTRPQLFGVDDPNSGTGNAHRMILWTSYEALVDLTDDQLDLWKARGVDGFVVQTRYLDEMGGIENWTGDPRDSLTGTIIDGADVHLRQRTLRDNRFVERCHARRLAVYLGIYLSNYHNLSTPLKVWDDDAGWAQILPIVGGAAGAAKLLGMDGIATDSEMYRSDSQTWNWDYPGVTKPEATVRALARQRGREWMTTILAAFPNIEIINYRIEIPGSWEEKVQAQVNHVAGVWNKSVFVDFWNGIVDAGGFRAIHFFDPIFYKSWQVGSGWNEALAYDVNGVRNTLAQRWANWSYASPRFFLSPFAWIDPGPSPGSFDDARPPDYVAAQLNAFHRWGEGNMFGLYAQHILDFDYSPYVSAMQTASAPDPISPGAITPFDRLRSAPASAPAAVEFESTLARPAVRIAGLRLEDVARGFHDPTDAAVAPDGRLFISERAGTVRVVRDGRVLPNPALVLNDVWAANDTGLLTIAIDPEFARDHFVYVVYAALSRRGEPIYRLARFREVGDRLAERAILLDGVPAPREDGTAVLRFGPDGRLYAAFGAGIGTPRLSDAAAYNGKVVRLNRDGTTPADQAAATPVFASGFTAPGGLDWQSARGPLWIGGRDQQDAAALRVRLTGEGPSAEASYRLAPSIAPPTIAFYRGDLIPALRGDLLMTGGDTASIARIRIDSTNSAVLANTESVLTDAGGPIRALTVGPDGVIYFCVNGQLHRLVPAATR